MKKPLSALSLAAIAVLGFSACTINVPTQPEEKTTPSTESPTQSSTPSESQRSEPTTEPSWTTVATITGNADQQSDTIALSGGKVRVSYDFTDTAGAGMIVAAVYVLTEGTDIMKTGGIPDVMVSEAGAGETILRKAAGEYYVKVTAANAAYTVTVEEQK